MIRGDVHYIRIGARTNIQDGSVLHVMRDTNPLMLGDDVTVGHSVTLHGCTIESRCLIGMGSIILNGAVIGTGSIIAAGTLVPERTIVPPGSLIMGQPGKAAPRADAPKIWIPSTLRAALRRVQRDLSRRGRLTKKAVASDEWLVVRKEGSWLSPNISSRDISKNFLSGKRECSSRRRFIA